MKPSVVMKAKRKRCKLSPKGQSLPVIPYTLPPVSISSLKVPLATSFVYNFHWCQFGPIDRKCHPFGRKNWSCAPHVTIQFVIKVEGKPLVNMKYIERCIHSLINSLRCKKKIVPPE